MAADPNQKLFSQISDLGRNINLLAESIKKNTAATESLISATDKSVKSEKEAATASNKAAAANPKEAKESNKDSGGIKDLTKMLSGLLGEKGPLMGKIVEMGKGKILSDQGAGKNLAEQSKDFTNIAGGLKGIIKAFQEGGVAKKEGKYLVGENGPEVVKLPKGAGVIPINIKDLMEGLKTVPELADLIKDRDTIDFYGSISNTSVVDSKGKVISLNRLSADYENKGDNAKDGETANKMNNAQNIIDSLIDFGRNNITNEVNKIDGETTDLATKSKLNYEKRDQLVEDILNEVSKNGDYYNTLSISKAALLATKTVLDKGGSKDTGAKAEESLDNKLAKESEADIKKEEAELKKSESVVNPKDGKKEKKGLLSRFKKEKSAEEEDSKKEKKGLLSRFKKEKSAEEEDSKKESKGSAILSKIGKGAENSLFAAASKATENLGAASPFAKSGLSALKKAIDKKGGIGEILSKKDDLKKAIDKKGGIGETLSKKDESKTSLGKKVQETPALINSVKKLTPLAKKELPKENEAPKEIMSAETKTSPDLSGSTPDKGDAGKKPETETSGSGGTLSDKDITDIKNALTRMAGLLEGTLTVSVLDQPFRPDSRRI